MKLCLLALLLAGVPSLMSVEDVAGLARVLLIGDPTSMGDTAPTRALLQNKVNVHRPLANCSSTGFGLKNLDVWLGEKKWDVIHFNFGLHDAQLPTHATKAKTVRLLTIGNSFSRNATQYLPDIVRAGGHELIHCPIVVGGASLELHATMAATNGAYKTGRSLKQELESDQWDYVTIQQASLKSHDISTYRPFAGQLRDCIKKYAPTAKLLMHQTWAYRCDDSRFATNSFTQKIMYDGLCHAYRTIAAELGARIIPVGDAFQIADTNRRWGYKPDKKFDFKNAKLPALPDQTHSLHTGWRWSKGKLSMDGHHAGVAGQYLGACVFYEVLYGENIVGNNFVPEGLDPDYARFLRETAHRAVAGLRRP